MIDAPAELLREPEGAWTSLGGHVLCPACQSRAERQAAAEHLIWQIRREIDQRQEARTAPSPYEAALIVYAMSQAEAPDDPIDDNAVAAKEVTAPDPSPADATVDSDDRLHIRLAITGAFLTGHPMDVRLSDYPAVQRDLGQVLRGPRWSTEGLYAEGGTYESGGGFSDDVPLVIARREGADLVPWLSSALRDFKSASPSPPDPLVQDLEATATSLTIDIYDLGVAVLTAWFEVAVSLDTKLEALATTLKQLAWLRPVGDARAPFAAVLQKIAYDTAAEYGRALTEAARDQLHTAWLSRAPESSPGGVGSREQDEHGRLLWLHPVHVLTTKESTSSSIDALAPTFSERIRLNGGVFAPGIGSSAVVVSEFRAAVTPIRLTQLHWAYYALYLEIDRGLLGVLNQPRWTERAPLKELERDADVVFTDFLRVSTARARLDSALSAIGGDELAIWAKISDVQRFDDVVGAVDRKLEALEKIAQRRVTQVTTDRARRIANTLGALSLLTVVTVLVAVLGAILGSLSPGIGPAWVRGVLVAASFLVSGAIWWVVFIRTPSRTASESGTGIRG